MLWIKRKRRNCYTIQGRPSPRQTMRVWTPKYTWIILSLASVLSSIPLKQHLQQGEFHTWSQQQQDNFLQQLCLDLLRLLLPSQPTLSTLLFQQSGRTFPPAPFGGGFWGWASGAVLVGWLRLVHRVFLPEWLGLCWKPSDSFLPPYFYRPLGCSGCHRERSLIVDLRMCVVPVIVILT